MVEAFLLNVEIFTISEVVILILALVIAVVRQIPGPVFFPFRMVAVAYTDLFRGIPLILVLYMLGFGVPGLGLGFVSYVSDVTYGIIALVSGLSGRHRVGAREPERCGPISRAPAMRPGLMLFDEVTSALDPELVAEVLSVIKELAYEGMTMLIATHEIGFARDIANHVCFLDEGKILEQGPPDRIFTSPENPRTRRFLQRIIAAGRL